MENCAWCFYLSARRSYSWLHQKLAIFTEFIAKFSISRASFGKLRKFSPHLLSSSTTIPNMKNTFRGSNTKKAIKISQNFWFISHFWDWRVKQITLINLSMKISAFAWKAHWNAFSFLQKTHLINLSINLLYVFFCCRSIRVPADASPRRSLPSNEKYRT